MSFIILKHNLFIDIFLEFSNFFLEFLVLYSSDWKTEIVGLILVVNSLIRIDQFLK